MTAGRDALIPGEAKNSFLTGTAAWSFVAVAQYILGVRPSAEGLVIDPCIPRKWKGFKMHRVFRGKTYHITVKNLNGHSKGVKKLVVNGKEIQGSVVPLDIPGKEITVEVGL